MVPSGMVAAGSRGRAIGATSARHGMPRNGPNRAMVARAGRGNTNGAGWPIVDCGAAKCVDA